MVKTSSFDMSVTLVVGIVLGMLVDCFVEERTPQIQAAAPRPTLDSLQAEIDSIISGSTVVGKAADAAVAHSLTNSSDPATQANAGAIRFERR